MYKFVPEELCSIRIFIVFPNVNGGPIFTTQVSVSLILTLSVADLVHVYMVCPIPGQ